MSTHKYKHVTFNIWCETFLPMRYLPIESFPAQVLVLLLHTCLKFQGVIFSSYFN